MAQANKAKHARSRPAPLQPDERLVTVLDIGTSKILCLMAAVAAAPALPEPPIRILGIGHQRSLGVRAGMITALADVERCVQATVEEAERQSGLRAEEVLVTLTCGRPLAESFVATAPVRGRLVRDGDLAYARAAAGRYAERNGRALLHLHELGYRIDGTSGIDDPRGMAGERLGLAVAAITADGLELRNVEALLERCYLEPVGYLAAIFASGLATITPAERDIGALVIDMGAGTTSFGIFSNGHLAHADAIPSGGDHITLDIAKALGTSRMHAERIKSLYGTVLAASSDATEPIEFPLAAERHGSDALTGETMALTEQTTRAELRAIIQPRIELVLREVRTRLEAAGLIHQAASGIVLTGGAAQLQGIGGLAATVFDRPVRLGELPWLAGLPEAVAPMAGAALGALQLRVAGNVTVGRTLMDANAGPLLGADGYFMRVGRWLRASFWDDESSRAAS